MAKCILPFLLALVLLVDFAAADVVLQWNATLRHAMQLDDTQSNPGWASRTMAMTNGAMYDTLMAIDRTHFPFLVDVQAAEPVARDAALAQAAHTVATHAYPGQAAVFDAQLAASLGPIADGPAKTAGIALGQSVGTAYIAARSGDGSAAIVPYTVDGGPGRWEPDPILSTPQAAWGPGWGDVTTFGIQSSSQFVVPLPPALDSQAYADALNEVKMLGVKTGSMRTTDQDEIAYFWAYDRQGKGPPPVLYNHHVAEIAEQMGNSVEENARLMAMASVAMADAGIAAWDAKYRDDFWRPVTAIRRADEDNNPDTMPDVDWEPLGAPAPEPFTPPFPAYVSGHATFGAAVFGVLAEFYLDDNIHFELTSDELPGVVREYSSFSQAAEENGRSRIYLGIHFNFDDIEGRALGGQIADWIAANHFQPVPEPSTIALGLAGGAMLAMALVRRRRQEK